MNTQPSNLDSVEEPNPFADLDRTPTLSNGPYPACAGSLKGSLDMHGICDGCGHSAFGE